MRYVLRADASQSIGTGHVMRLSAIGEELIERGEEVIFVGEFSDIPWLALRINNLGLSQILLKEGDYSSNPETDVLILDSYIIPVEEEFVKKDRWKRIVVITDYRTPAYEAHLVVRPGLAIDQKSGSMNKTLEGPKYIPFRKSIRRNRTSSTPNEVLEILVVGGGTDSFNFAAAVCEALENTEDNFHANIFTNQIVLDSLDSRFTAIPIGSKLDWFADICQLVFTTASTTSLEFVAREVAVGIGCAIDNQAEYYESLTSYGVAIPIGEFVDGSWEINQLNVQELVYSKELRERLRQKCSGLIDLQGAKRIVDEILKL